MPMTGKYTQKLYKCSRCGKKSTHGTNHWGDIYPKCEGCSWKNPLQPFSAHVCLEAPPKGIDIPPPWKITSL